MASSGEYTLHISCDHDPSRTATYTGKSKKDCTDQAKNDGWIFYGEDLPSEIMFHPDNPPPLTLVGSFSEIMMNSWSVRLLIAKKHMHPDAYEKYQESRRKK